MTIKTFDAFTRLSINDINRTANFIYANSGDFRDSKSAIRKSLLYAAKEIAGLGGYVFIMEHENNIVGAVVVNKTGMNEYLSENILVYIAVKEEYRGQGITSELIKHTKRYCRGAIAIHINKDNPMIKLFEDEGFEARNIEMRLTRK
ncbi:GNAT family N-acetyltransferase [Tamlana sp. 2_MG-2023]|uniref:GNAT family N-acetyltransferase n=1 Tax=unclassified Tamlana TaxID=2614803 RepID=UPI0026E141ED|nr:MULTISPECIES: GNAT family N-acetyltransferase [unclassified Tamlana]MDO6758797.1 GNAT family N-acetyltransferase [Tamlana sp. 2_MG-2023]MDO6789496.1 GNAT family N-acetyltransferase [Tamlana sp. 1_MG-2023]